GAPVKLDATGKIVTAAATEPYNNIIGVSIHKAGAGELATVAMKGYAVVWARANADSQEAGPVAWKGMSAVTNETAFGKYGALADDTPAGSATGVPIVPAVNCLAGWALDAGDEDD